MTKLDEYDFGDYLDSAGRLKNESGVYAIWCFQGGAYRLIDIGESEQVKTRVEDHERRSCWEEKCQQGTIKYSAYYTDAKRRTDIERYLRDKYEPPCGKQ